MKRIGAIVLALAMMMGLVSLSSVSVSAQGSFTYVTDFDYAVIRSGGVDGAFVYGAYENNGKVYKMGLLTADGEQTRTAWSADGWNALFAPSAWKTTIHHDASALCPYASSHGDSTICPYMDVSLVTLTNAESGATLSSYYMYNPVKRITTGGSLHVCWGRYGYVSPETLKWDGKSNCVAVRDENGQWGVFDFARETMLTDYAYADMSAVYGGYAKVSNGTAWGRLDLSGATETVYSYASSSAFSVTEELREIANGVWQVFNADNQPISIEFSATNATWSYEPTTRLVLKTVANGEKTLIGLKGTTVATFANSQTVMYVGDGCYAVEQYNDNDAVVGVALARASCDEIIVPPMVGDVTLDGVVDSHDTRLLLLYLVEMEDLTDEQLTLADVTANAIIDSDDARALMRLMIEV